jgi:integrase
MGYTRKRVGKSGKPRYTAYYLDIRGKERSAGTYGNEKTASKAWQSAEAKVAEGRGGDPARGRQTFQRYVEVEWLPHHEMEPTTREGYTYSLYAHIMDHFGPMRMREILASHVREWVTKLKNEGVSPATIRLNKAILSAIFTTALIDEVTVLHPCRGVKTPTVPKKDLRIVTPEEFDVFYDNLPDAVAQLLVETAVESGMRWGELAELRPKDINLRTGVVTVSRKVVEVNPKFHPDAGRFIVQAYPKDKETRHFRLSRQIIAKVRAYIETMRLADGDLLFAYSPVVAPDSGTNSTQDQAELGLTEPNAAGRRYRHGTLSGYSAGKCRCGHCRRAYATYRAERRRQGKDEPRHPRRWDTTGHIPRRWFRDAVLKPALITSKIDVDIKMHGLRHAHASWLLAGGADLQVVKERLGHGSISTTEKYLHTLPDADDTAVDAFAKIRNRSGR